MTNRIEGIHHVTAMSGNPQRNVDFYSGILGLRLVKVTVNYDDPGTYHLYYGDPAGSPGTLLTFFPWPESHRGTVGASQAEAMQFAVARGSLGYWAGRLQDAGVVFTEKEMFNQSFLSFSDHDGFALELVDSVASPNPAAAWGGIAADQAIHGFHGVRLASLHPDRSADLLTGTMGYELAGEEDGIQLFQSPADIGNFLQLNTNNTQIGRGGVGTVHHVAFRAKDDADHADWRAKFVAAGMRPTDFIDRNYFHSIYFREPGSILYEIATDPPGMTYNEPFETLGTTLVLPPWLEPHRPEIASGLPGFTSREGAVFP